MAVGARTALDRPPRPFHRPLLDAEPRAACRRWYSRALLCAGLCGKPALPTLLGRGNLSYWVQWFWVGHSGKCFAVELMSDREPGFCSAPGDSRPGCPA